MPIKNALLTSRMDRRDALEHAKRLINTLLEHPNINNVFIDETLKDKIGLMEKRISYISIEEFNNVNADLLIVIGGDGSLLRALHFISRNPPPVFGVRMGRYGFLMEIDVNESVEGLQRILENRTVKMTSKPRIRMVIKDKKLPPVLNDYVFTAPKLKMVHIKVVKFKTLEVVMDTFADGLIVSPTAGSTAYSLSAGGPVIDENLKAIVITPLNPMQLRARPIVFDIKTKLKINILDREVDVYSDGIRCCRMEEGSDAIIEYWDDVLFYRLHYNYYDKLRWRDYV